MDHFNNKKVLVFGGCGFIGSNFIRALLTASPDAIIANYDKITYSGNEKNLVDLEGKFEKLYGYDITSPEVVDGVVGVFKPDYIINFAAETHVDRSIHDGGKYFIDTNVVGVYNILQAVKKYNVQKFVQVSTDEVFGSVDEGKFTEKSLIDPSSLYSATKASADLLCNAFYKTYGVPVIVTHCSNNYGPYQYPEKQIPFWIYKLVKGEKMPIYGDGKNVRDWVHVDDHVSALGAVMLNGQPGVSYLIGADNERTNIEMASMILSAMGQVDVMLDDYVEHVTDRPGHDRRYAIDYSETSALLGWYPKYGAKEFYAKLKETVKWYMDHQDWVDAVIAKNGESNKHI